MSMLEPLPPILVSDGQDTLDLDEVVEVRIPYLPTEVTKPSWDLPPFSGKKVVCAKCGLGVGSDDSTTSTHHHRTATVGGPCYEMIRFHMDIYNQIGFPEHLDRRCPVCGYQWVEALADGPAQPEED